jgi:hypothetical protein
LDFRPIGFNGECGHWKNNLMGTWKVVLFPKERDERGDPWQELVGNFYKACKSDDGDLNHKGRGGALLP